jgi:hypothetical protein
MPLTTDHQTLKTIEQKGSQLLGTRQSMSNTMATGSTTASFRAKTNFMKSWRPLNPPSVRPPGPGRELRRPRVEPTANGMTLASRARISSPRVFCPLRLPLPLCIQPAAPRSLLPALWPLLKRIATDSNCTPSTSSPCPATPRRRRRRRRATTSRPPWPIGRRSRRGGRSEGRPARTPWPDTSTSATGSCAFTALATATPAAAAAAVGGCRRPGSRWPQPKAQRPLGGGGRRMSAAAMPTAAGRMETRRHGMHPPVAVKRMTTAEATGTLAVVVVVEAAYCYVREAWQRFPYCAPRPPSLDPPTSLDCR